METTLKTLKEAVINTIIAYEKKHGVYDICVSKLDAAGNLISSNAAHAKWEVYQAFNKEDIKKAMSKWLPNVEY